MANQQKKVLIIVSITAVITAVILIVLFAKSKMKQMKRSNEKSNVNDLKLSNKGMDLIKRHEGYRNYAYDDLQPNKRITHANQVIGTLTIGYGHTKGVYVGQTTNRKEATEFLKKDLEWAENLVKRNIRVPISQDQYDALVSHAYNTGRASENLYSLINSGAAPERIREFWTSTYITSKGVRLNGLITRRTEEADLFLS